MPSSDNEANDAVAELQRRRRDLLRAQREAQELSCAMAGPDKKPS